MQNQRAALIAVLIGIIIRIMLIGQAGGIAYDAYETVLHVEHIKETGMPLAENSLAWGGANVATMPAFHYLLAFADLFLPQEIAFLAIPNILLALIPIPVFLLAKQLTKNTFAISAVTIGSAFLPLTYATTLTADPISLALPVLLLAYYFFIRLGRTPKDQILFITLAILLTITHPISLLFMAAMALTLLLSFVQRIRFSVPMAEATIFMVFLTIWANSLRYKHTIQELGIAALWTAGTRQPLPGGFAAMIGVVTLLGGAYAAFHTLTKERNTAAHALVGLGAMTALFIMTGTIPVRTGTYLLSIVLLILTATSIELLLEARKRSRIPGVHVTVLIGLIIAFIFTAAVPAAAIGLQQQHTVPTPQDEKVVEVIEAFELSDRTVLWDMEHAFYLQAHGIKVPYDKNRESEENADKIVAELQNLQNLTSEIKIIEQLNAYRVSVLVVPREHELVLGDRCFIPLFKSDYEVYQLRCVVQ